MTPIERLGAFLFGTKAQSSPRGAGSPSPGSSLELKSTPYPALPVASSSRVLTANALDSAAGATRSSTWAYAGVTRVARAVASVPLRAELLDSDGNWQPAPGHPLEVLLREPNPDAPGYEMIYRLVQHLYGRGNGLWHVVTVGSGSKRLPKELWPLNPSTIIPKLGPDGRLEHYEHTANRRKTRISPAEIVHFQFLDPDRPYWGLSPFEVAADALEQDREAVRWNRVSLANRATTDGVLSVEQPLSDDQFAEFRAQARAYHEGGSNAHRLWILGAGSKFTPMGSTPVEMDFLNSRKFNREEVAAVVGISPLLIGGSDGATFANLEWAKRLMWEDVIVPLLGDVCRAASFALVPYWHPESLTAGVDPNLRLVPDLSGVPALEENYGERVKNAVELVKAGWPPNAVNQRLKLGFDDVDGGDVPRQVMPTRDNETSLALNRARGPAGRKSLPDDMSEEQKTLEWKTQDDSRDAWARRLARSLASVLEDEGKAVAAAFERDGLRAATSAVDADRWLPVLRAAYEAVGEHYGQQEADRIADLAKAGAGPAELKRSHFDPGRLAAFIRRTTAERVKLITSTTRDRIKAAVADGLENDEGSPAIAKRILSMFAQWRGDGDSEITRSRAYTIARTELAVIAGHSTVEGAKQASTELGLEMTSQWLSSRDDRVRDDHREMDGETVPLGGTFSNGLEYPSEVNCFVPGTFVQGAFVAGLKAEYSGEVIEIVTAGGRKLTVTPNHPVLTRRGFVGAQYLRQGDQALSYASAVGGELPAGADEHAVPTRIEQVLSALRQVRAKSLRDAFVEDLHGDAISVKGKIEIIGGNGKLLADTTAEASYLTSDGVLEVTPVIEPQPVSASPSGFALERVGVPSPPIPSGRQLAMHPVRVLPDLHPLEPLRVGPAADLDAGRLEVVRKAQPDDARLVANLLHRGAGLVTLDEIIEVRNGSFSGHVYDLQTLSGWLVANDIITSNCRCVTLQRVRR